MSFFIPAPSSGVAVLTSFRRSWHSHIPLGLLFNFQGTVRRSFTYSHRERSNAPPKREKYLRIKTPFTHLDKGCRNAHPFPGFFSKIFLRKNLPFTYLELQSQMTPYFSEKLKIFFVLLRDDLFLLTEEKVSSLIPTGKGLIPTLFQKIFCCL